MKPFGPSLGNMVYSLTCVMALCCCVWMSSADEVMRPYFTAAVYEHRRFGGKYDSASEIIQINLDYYVEAAEIAKSKEADVIVFPEYGLFPPVNRSQLKEYLEYIPNPMAERINPCEEPDRFGDRPILCTLSCIASKFSIVVVANTGDIQDCAGKDGCPQDGVFHFNTNVVFDRDGTLMLKYHKEHLFFESGMDIPKRQQNTTFRTDFGTFATYTGFDIGYAKMGEVGSLPGVDAILYPTMWFDGAYPKFMSMQFWQPWALGNDASLLAANIQIPGLSSVGSGIFHSQDGALVYTYNPDDGVSKVIVANVPRKGFPSVSPNSSITAIEMTWGMDDNGDDILLDRVLSNDASHINDVKSCMEPDLENYTYVRLSEPSGQAKVCHNGMCCSLSYTTKSGFGDDNFYLAVYNGTYNICDRYFWCEEYCVLARYETQDMSCATLNTVFQDVYMRANFSSGVVYPQVVGAGMRLVPLTDWHQYSGDSSHHPHHLHPHFENSHHHYGYEKGERSLHFENKTGRKLDSVSMKGRCYARDPPYQ